MRVIPMVASRFLSDGGTTFGPVPKALWAQMIAPNDMNQIPVTAISLLVELPDGRKGLIETGCGTPARYTDKERAIHGLDEDWPLETALRAHGTGFDDIDFVVLTHLHWDHAGGAGRPGDDGQIQPTFPRAVHYAHAEEWSNATSSDPLLYKAYPESTIAPLRALEDGRLQLVEGDETEVLPGISMVRTGGHTSGHCVIVLRDDDMVLDHADAEPFASCPYFVVGGDLCPTRHHLRLVYQLAYDHFPLDVRAWKQTWLKRISEDNALLVFDHDLDLFGATLRPDERREYQVDKGLQINPGGGA